MDPEAVRICAELGELINVTIFKEGETVSNNNSNNKCDPGVGADNVKNTIREGGNQGKNLLAEVPVEHPPRVLAHTSYSPLQVPQQTDMSANEKMDTSDGKTSTCSSASENPSFPPEYRTIRAAHVNGKPTKRLGGKRRKQRANGYMWQL